MWTGGSFNCEQVCTVAEPGHPGMRLVQRTLTTASPVGYREIAEWIPYVLSFTRPGMFRTSLFYRKLFKDLHAASRDEPDNEADNHMMTLGWRNAYKT